MINYPDFVGTAVLAGRKSDRRSATRRGRLNPWMASSSGERIRWRRSGNGLPSASSDARSSGAHIAPKGAVLGNSGGRGASSSLRPRPLASASIAQPIEIVSRLPRTAQVVHCRCAASCQLRPQPGQKCFRLPQSWEAERKCSSPRAVARSQSGS